MIGTRVFLQLTNKILQPTLLPIMSARCKTEKASNIGSQLFKPISVPPYTSGHKISIIGSGQVGIATAVSLLLQGISNDLCLVDVQRKRTMGEMMDMQHASVFLNDPRISCSDSFSASACSTVCVVTAGVAQKPGESRLALAQRNADIMKKIIPQVVEHSPETIIVMVSNPVDIMTYIAWKLSKFPMNRVFGTGTFVDTTRFRYFIAKRLGVASSSVHGNVIGEHGDSSVPVWSGVTVASLNLSSKNKDIGTDNDPEKWSKVHRDVVQAAGVIIAHKGHTNWAIGVCAARVVAAILDNTRHIYPLSIPIKGLYCIEDDVCLSVPCVLSGHGVVSTLELDLTECEHELLLNSAKVVAKVQKGIKF